MAGRKSDFTLTKLDDLFTTQAQRDEEQLSKIRDIPLELIDDFPDHPFKVRDDEDMMQLVESVKERGVITPATVRQKEDGRYELVSGHRRKRACELAGFETLRSEIVDLNRDEATILMVESNFQRSEILPSEKAFAEYLELYRQNEDMVGWIKVEDTNINYPVVQSVNEPNFYLKHKFDKTYSAYGCPYVQENCDVQKPSDNIIIYGHHMNDGSMFTGLMKYRNKSFWEGHKTITFDTLTDRHQYEVIAVFKTVVYTNSSDSFKYYEFTDAENAAEFDAYVAKCKELSLYDTGVSAEYGDKLISLSTCEYSRNNGRLVVVAKRVD